MKIKIDRHDEKGVKTNKIENYFHVKDAFISGKYVRVEFENGAETGYLGTILRTVNSNDEESF